MDSKVLTKVERGNTLAGDEAINLHASRLDRNHHQHSIQQYYQQQQQQDSPTNSTTNTKNKKLFPKKLWDLINDDKYSFCLRWSDDGQLVYLNRDEFEDSYLKTADNQFHTQKAISFVRQMNMYGFRKVDDCYYENDNFKRDCEHLLKNMIRKHPNKNPNSANNNIHPDDIATNQNLPYNYKSNHPSSLIQPTTGSSLLASKHSNSDDTGTHLSKKLKLNNNIALNNGFTSDYRSLPTLYRTNPGLLPQPATNGTSLLASVNNITNDPNTHSYKKSKSSSNNGDQHDDAQVLPNRSEPLSLLQPVVGTSLLASMDDNNETSINLNKKSTRNNISNNLSLNDGISMDNNLPFIYRTDQPSSLLQPTAAAAATMMAAMNNNGNETNIQSALYANFAFYLLVTKWIEETLQAMSRS